MLLERAPITWAATRVLKISVLIPRNTKSANGARLSGHRATKSSNSTCTILDVIMWRWASKKFPVEVRAWGGRSTDPDLPSPQYGDRYSHCVVDYDFGDGLRLMSSCSQERKTSGEVGERIIGSKGIMTTSGGCRFVDKKGKVTYMNKEKIPRRLRRGTQIPAQRNPQRTARQQTRRTARLEYDSSRGQNERVLRQEIQVRLDACKVQGKPRPERMEV